MQVQRISNNNTSFGAILKIDNPSEFSSKALEILTKKAEKIGRETDIIQITLGKPLEYNAESGNCVAFSRRSIICSVTNAVYKVMNRKELNCLSYGKLSMPESTEKRIGTYLDGLKNKIRK